eukprot:5304168-Alexandrium_andersonii.AAC.1
MAALEAIGPAALHPPPRRGGRGGKGRNVLLRAIAAGFPQLPGWTSPSAAPDPPPCTPPAA